VITEVGACLREYTSNGLGVIDGYPETAICSSSRGMPLLPWPNRIAGGKYRFDGQPHQLPIDRPDEGNAIHGLTRWLIWKPVTHRADSLELELELTPRPGYPFHLVLRHRYALSDDGLAVMLTVENVGARAAPFGAGYHPYIRPRSSLADCLLLLRAEMCLEHVDRGLPGKPFAVSGTSLDFSHARPVGALRLNHCFTQLARDEFGRADVAVDGAVVWLGRGFKWVLVFSGDDLQLPDERRRSLAVEPMTCPADAFNSRQDLILLDPGQRLSLDWGIRPRTRLIE
jgi:aldose 1-epimerase